MYLRKKWQAQALAQLIYDLAWACSWQPKLHKVMRTKISNTIVYDTLSILKYPNIIGWEFMLDNSSLYLSYGTGNWAWARVGPDFAYQGFFALLQFMDLDPVGTEYDCRDLNKHPIDQEKGKICGCNVWLLLIVPILYHPCVETHTTDSYVITS